MEEKKKKPKKVRLSEEAISEAMWSEAETINGIPISAEEKLVILRSEIIDISKKIAKSKRQRSKFFWNANLFKSRYEYPLIQVLHDYFQVAKKLSQKKKKSEEEYCVPSLGEYYDYGKFGIHNFPPAMAVDRGAVVKKIWGLDLQDHVFDIWHFWIQHISETQMQPAEEKDEEDGRSKDPLSILDHVNELLVTFKKRRQISEEDWKTMDAFIDMYKECGAIKKISLHTGIGTDKIRKNFRNPIRIPPELNKMLDNEILDLTNNPIIAKEIVLYATDYFNWDNEEKSFVQDAKSRDVIRLAVDLAKFFKENHKFKDDFAETTTTSLKPVSESTRKNREIKEILADYPFELNPDDYNRKFHRTRKQYFFICFISKCPEAIMFLRRWEYEKKRFLPKGWATEIISQIKTKGNAEEFVNEYSSEFS